MSAELFAQFPFQHLARSIARQIGREDDPLGCLVGARHLPMRWVRARSSSARTLKSDLRGAISCGVVPGYQFTLLRRSEEHTSELQSLMRISYAVFCLTEKKTTTDKYIIHHI